MFIKLSFYKQLCRVHEGAFSFMYIERRMFKKVFKKDENCHFLCLKNDIGHQIELQPKC